MSEMEQLVRVSRLYYELGETQSAIAEQLGVTRPQVSRLLKRARAEGIVEIRIVDRTTADSPAAEALTTQFGDLRREADAVGRLRDGDERAVLDAVEGGDQQAGARARQPVEQVAGGVGGPDRLGEHAEHRAGVEPLLEQEGRGAGDLVAVPGPRAAPGAAPRQAGSSEKCRLTQPCRGMSSAAGGTSAP